MADDPDKPERLGIYPAGLVGLGLLVMLAVAFGMTKIFDFVRWVAEWISGNH